MSTGILTSITLEFGGTAFGARCRVHRTQHSARSTPHDYYGALDALPAHALELPRRRRHGGRVSGRPVPAAQSRAPAVRRGAVGADLHDLGGLRGELLGTVLRADRGAAVAGGRSLVSGLVQRTAAGGVRRQRLHSGGGAD